jgi:hypothetical protein
MIRKKPEVDIVLDVLHAVVQARPGDAFAKSLLHQYIERGSLSKKQLMGLFGKAQKLEAISETKLATLEAIILRMNIRERSAPPPHTPLYTQDPELKQMIDDVLAKFPQHKRVLFLQAKFENNEVINASEKLELKNFQKVAAKK